MRILITGGFGYLGGRLAQHLARGPGNELLLGSRRQLDPPAWLPNASVVRTPWESEEGLAEICSDVDAIVHLAGMNAPDSVAHPAGALELNGGATTRLVNAAAKKRVARFIYFSTAHVYASPLSGTITEATHPSSPDPYATSHLAGEEAVRGARAERKIDATVVRLSNAYGAPAHKDANCWMLLVNDLCRQAVTTGGMVLRGTGLQRRDFIPIEDVCRAAEHLLAMPAVHQDARLFNLGGEWSPTIWEMANLIQERCAIVLGAEPELVRKPPPPGESSDELDYRLDALREAGFRVGADRVTEIDGLLECCRMWFG